MSLSRGSRRTGRRALTALLLIAVTTLLTPSAATAEPVARTYFGYTGGPALTADGRVAIGERLGNGRVRVQAYVPSTRVVTLIAQYPALESRRAFSMLTLAGTGGMLTARYDVLANPSASAGEQATPSLLLTRTETVLPLPPLRLASCERTGGAFSPLEAAGGDGFVATIGDDCFTRAAVQIRTAAGTRTIPPGAVGVDISELRATGPMVAWVENALADPSGLTRTLVIARGATGEVLLRTPLDSFPYQIGLGADGTVVWNTLGDVPSCSLRVVSPAAPAPRTIALPRGLCPHVEFGRATLAVAEGRIVYRSIGPRGAGYAVSDLQGGAHQLAEVGLTARSSPVAFDGRTAFVVREDCDADWLLAVDAALVADGPTQRPCTIKRENTGSRLRVARDRSVRVDLRCAAGCRGELRLVEQRRGRRERLAGSVAFVGDPGRVSVRPRIARWARARAGCRDGLRVAAVLFAHGAPRRGLGPYRIVSRSRCRRTGGPAFRAPLPAPRP